MFVPSERPTMVYVLRGERSGIVKIGCTKNLRQRAKQIALYLDEPMRVLGTAPGSYPEESAALARFKRYRVTGKATKHREFFNDPDGAIAAWAKTLTPSTLVVRPAWRHLTHGAIAREAAHVAFLATPAGREHEARVAALSEKIRSDNERLYAQWRTEAAARAARAA